MELMNQAKAFAVKQALAYMDKNPEENIPKLIGWLEDFNKKGTLKEAIEAVKKVTEDPSNNWYQLIKSLWTDIDSGVRNRLFENFIINASMLGYEKQCENKEKYGCNIPWAILMDPTSACNLKCTGCWAAEYGNHMNLTYEEMETIVKQGKALGTYVYLYTGGEPLVRKKVFCIILYTCIHWFDGKQGIIL